VTPPGSSSSSPAQSSAKSLFVQVPGWSQTLSLHSGVSSNDPVIRGTPLDIVTGVLPASQQIDILGSFLTGGVGANKMYGLSGWDVIDAGAGNDSVRGGNGRDVITGGIGRDQCWGDFGRNYYNGNLDGAEDLIVIKSDQHLENWWYGKAENSPNGEKADVIEDLESIDRIRILGVTTEQISVQQASVHGLSGLGVFADGSLEALYIGGDLSVEQLLSQVDGDASGAVMNNSQGFYAWG